MNAKDRSGAIDLFKLIAAFSVVTLHIHVLIIPEPWQVLIRLLARWAVPFFFLVSGYFAFNGIQNDQNGFLAKRIDRLMGIFIVANLIYLLQRFLYFKDLKLDELISFNTLVWGTYFHLWFISSMIVGFIIIWFLLYRNLEKLLLPLSVLLLILILLSDSYIGITGLKMNPDVFRFLISIPFLYVGIYIAKIEHRTGEGKAININISVAVLLILAGIFLQIIEARVLFVKTGYNPYSHQLLIGTILFTFGMFFLSKKLLISEDNILAVYGRKYSLGIYLYHIFFYFTVYQVFLRFIDRYTPMIKQAVLYSAPLIIFLLSLFLLWITDKYINPLFRIINGDFSGKKP